jgi:hypothetical protein
MNAFKVSVVNSKASIYTSVPGITKMYNKWKERGQMQAPQEPGSLRTAALGDVCASIAECIQQGIDDSNGITHKDVGKVLEEW